MNTSIIKSTDYIKYKYNIDFIFALILLLILSPFLILIYIIIFLQIKENPIYISYRAGVNNSKFKLYKFKSMHSYPNKEKRHTITIKDDKRIFPFGKFLRITKIDELPQLINIILGQMSFIGPRPEDIKIVKYNYTHDYAKTLLVRPGLSSPGSLYNFVYIETRIKSFEEYITKYLPQKISLDIDYIYKISFLYDLYILLLTIVVIILLPLFRNKPRFLPQYNYIREREKINL